MSSRAATAGRGWNLQALGQGVVLALVASLIYLAPADLPLSGDEAMYAGIAKDLAQRGQPLDLRLNGVPYLNKPPLFFSAVAVGFHFFGIRDRVAQVTAGVFSVLAVIALFLGCRLMFGRWEPGFLAALVFLLTPEAVHWGRGVRLEGMLGFFSIMAVVAALVSVDRPAACLVVFVVSALACLTKGPQGLFPLPLLPLLWWQAGVWRSRVTSTWTWLGVVVFLLLVFPWLFWRWQTQSLFVDVYVRDQVVSTVIGEPWPGRGTLWYLGKLLRTYWPWAPFAAAGVFVWHRQGAGDSGKERRAVAAWLWYAAIVFTVITLSALKKSRYLYLLYPGLAVLSGYALEYLARRIALVRPLLTGAACLAALLILLVGDKPSGQAQANISEALAVASRLPAAEPVLLTSAVAQGRHGFGKILAFYAKQSLHACSGDCFQELVDSGPAVWVIMRRRELPRFAEVWGQARVMSKTQRLAVLRLPDRFDKPG